MTQFPPKSLFRRLLTNYFIRYIPVLDIVVSDFVCGASLPTIYQFTQARFCHDSMAVVQLNPKSVKSSHTKSIRCGPGLPVNALDRSEYPHHHDSRDDGRSDCGLDFTLSETFRCLEDAHQSGKIAENDYPEILEVAAQLYSQLQ